MKSLDMHDLAKLLPRVCATKDLTTGTTILIKFGITGYWPMPGIDVDYFNETRGITPAQVEAMHTGSMFGWDCPGANPENYEPAIPAEEGETCQGN